MLLGPFGLSTGDVARTSDAEQALYDRLGPKAMAMVRNCTKSINVSRLLLDFQNGRDPILRDGEFYPRVPYNIGEGDEEFAAYIQAFVLRTTGERIEPDAPVEATVVRRRRIR